ncbi:DUF7668 domain-containing protein [Dyadobacter sp. BHUBP1]|uniref:DUF7668 domain-containing protein n=1 Tax=Dyadobacter sp. BHUBP1 TaxID=3424178 RepID=UPI003D34DE2A
MERGEIRNLLTELINSLVAGKFLYIYTRDKNKRLSADEMKTVIYDYPGLLTHPPDTAFDNFRLYGNESDDGITIEFNLWYDNSESDLTMTMTVYSSGEYSIEDIHVL